MPDRSDLEYYSDPWERRLFIEESTEEYMVYWDVDADGAQKIAAGEWDKQLRKAMGIVEPREARVATKVVTGIRRKCSGVIKSLRGLFGHHAESERGVDFRIYSRSQQMVLCTPTWLSKDDWAEIDGIYQKRRSMGSDFHVDHIVPVKGRTVCGLHVPWNLQILDAITNISKGNRLWVTE